VWMQTICAVSGQRDITKFYNFESLLGKGQFGVVHRATNISTMKQVAIKTVRKVRLSPIEVLQLYTEIDVLRQCGDHPNLIKLIDVFHTADHCYIVMEYVKGKDLFEYLKSHNYRISEPQVQKILYSLLAGVSYLHERGIIHRDLKLENIIMSDDSESAVPVIVDFGLSKIFQPKGKAQDPFGTVGYCAPEVLKRIPYSFSCDMWSLGCITFALISGCLPFDCKHTNGGAGGDKETKRSTIEDPLSFQLQRVWQRTSLECRDLIAHMLHKNPVQRLTVKGAVGHRFFDSLR
jgi:serine/threonine protein kinase